MTEREIDQFVGRMLDHLNRLLLNRDMSENDYHAAILDLAEWEETEVLKMEAERRQTTDNEIAGNLKPETL